MTRATALEVALALTGATAAHAADSVVVPEEGGYYEIGQAFSGPCTPAATLPTPSDGQQTARSTWTESFFQSTLATEPWATIAPRTAPDEEGVFPQPQNLRGPCLGDQRLEVDGFVDVVSPLGERPFELGQNSMVTRRITETSAVCGSDGQTIGPDSHWCRLDHVEEEVEIVDIATFIVYWHCAYTVESATGGAKIRARNGKLRQAEALAMAGETIIVPRGGRVVIESGPVRLTLLTGRYTLDFPKTCEIRFLTSGRLRARAPAPTTPTLSDGVMRATLLGMRNFRVQTPDARVSAAPAAKPRGGPAEDQETVVRVERDAATRTTKVCTTEGRALVRPRSGPKRSLTVEPGRCVTVTSARP